MGKEEKMTLFNSFARMFINSLSLPLSLSLSSKWFLDCVLWLIYVRWLLLVCMCERVLVCFYIYVCVMGESFSVLGCMIVSESESV